MDFIEARQLLGPELFEKALERGKGISPRGGTNELLASALGVIWELVEPTRGRKLRDCPCGHKAWDFVRAGAPTCGHCSRLGVWLAPTAESTPYPCPRCGIAAESEGECLGCGDKKTHPF